MDLQKTLVKIHEHVIKAHQEASAYHNEMANCHGNMLASHKEGTPDREFHEAAQASHVTARDGHDDAIEECRKDMAECEKADTATMIRKMIGDTLVPTRVSVVAPPRPAAPNGLTAIPRPGQPEIKNPAVPNVAPEFQKLFSMEDGQEERPIL
jgi:hypothetical protein